MRLRPQIGYLARYMYTFLPTLAAQHMYTCTCTQMYSLRIQFLLTLNIQVYIYLHIHIYIYIYRKSERCISKDMGFIIQLTLANSEGSLRANTHLSAFFLCMHSCTTSSSTTVTSSRYCAAAMNIHVYICIQCMYVFIYIRLLSFFLVHFYTT